MKKTPSIALSIFIAALASSASAHDASLHEREGAAAPDCSQVTDMDPSKMDMKDPLMKALQEKCKGAMDHHDMEGDDMSAMPGMEHPMVKPTDTGDKQ